MKTILIVATLFVFASMCIADIWHCSKCYLPCTYGEYYKVVSPTEGEIHIPGAGSRTVKARAQRTAECNLCKIVHDDGADYTSNILSVPAGGTAGPWSTGPLGHDVGSASWTLISDEGN